jgi:hypothetical protein
MAISSVKENGVLVINVREMLSGFLSVTGK